jgi:uncharacterized protein (TIGR02246 family)
MHAPAAPARPPVVVGFLLLLAVSPLGAQSSTPDGRHDFDVHRGTWTTHLLRLRQPLSGSMEWVEYRGTTVVREIWNGDANLVELDVDGPAGRLEVLSLRLYDAASGQWSLNSSRRGGGALGVPMVGRFLEGRGEFRSTETFEGSPIHVRFVIEAITPDSLRFEQSFSDDGGRTWEPNWIATDARTGGATDASADARSADSAAVREVLVLLDASWNARDADRFSQAFSDDGSLGFPDRGLTLDGRARIRTYFTEQFPGFASDIRHQTRVHSVRDIASGLVAVDGEVEIHRVGASPEILRRFAVAAVAARTDDGWRIRLLRAVRLADGAQGPGSDAAPEPPNDDEILDVSVHDVRPLAETPPPFPVVESYLVVNPINADQLLASAMATSTRQSLVYRSDDGGDSWRQVDGPEGPDFEGGDPMLAFDGNGRAYLSTVRGPIHLWRSDDGGRSWAGPAKLGGRGSDDRQWVAASTVPGEEPLPLYAAAKRVTDSNGATQHVLVTAVSRDGGQTFNEPTLTLPDSGYLHTPANLVVRRDGTVLLPYLVHYGFLPGGEGRIWGDYWLLTSGDGGGSWSEPIRIGGVESIGHGGDEILSLKGFAAGDLIVDETGGTFQGSAYMVWPTLIDDRIQIVLVRSGDGGRTWEEPVRVNDGGFESNHSTPMVAVNRDGLVAVTWNDRRNDPADECFQHYVAISRDGGTTFGPSRPISERQACPGVGSRWMNGGETQGLAALPDGSFRVVWSVGVADDLAPWTAVVRPR